MAATTHWHVDEIDDALAADFDGSLSGLGMELGTASFNMSDALMALPNLSSLKQEHSQDNGVVHICSDTSESSDGRRLSEEMLSQHEDKNDEILRPIVVLHGKKNRLPLGNDDDVSSAIKRFCVSTEREIINSQSPSHYGKVLLPQLSVSCATPLSSRSPEPTGRCRHSTSAPDLRTAVSQSSPTSVSASILSQMLQLQSASPPALSLRDCSPILNNSHFQYVLGAATSIASKMHEETMTYLNQGQSYEVKLKKLGDLTEMRGKMLKSVIRVGFQERRLQYTEKEQITQWQQYRAGDRILEIDIPLSYGVYDVVNEPQNVNLCEFLWDPTKETGVFIRVNCISTEFTPKKHGGEKGVPFRIQIETYSHGEGVPQRLHAASCQVKVFKPKGADRKHKTDREKMCKRSQNEQEKYQPSYDCTVFTECPSDTIYTSSPPIVAATSTTPTCSSNSSGNFSPQSSVIDVRSSSQQLEQAPSPPTSSTTDLLERPDTPIPEVISIPPNSLASDATSNETAQWLQQQRFGSFVRTFSSFSGADILRLSRDDLIQICGLADGIRLYNALHSRSIRPRLTLYVCISSEQVFRAVYLENLSVADLIQELGNHLCMPTKSIQSIFINGPSAIRVLVTDEVIKNMQEEAMFILELLKDQSKDTYRILLKSYSQ